MALALPWAAGRAGVLVVGSDADASKVGEVIVYDGSTLGVLGDSAPYASFKGGVRVASGDINADGRSDLAVVPGAGAGPMVQMFSGANGAPLGSFDAFSAAFTGGVYVAAGDLNRDGHADIIAAVGSGAAPNVKALSGTDQTPLLNFFAYDVAFTGGVRVAAGDVGGDGHADIITGPGPGAAPMVRVFSGVSGAKIDEFLAFDNAFLGGVFVASADLDGDGRADIIAGADSGAAPAVAAFSGAGHAPLGSFLAYATGFTGGVRVAAGDIDGDGHAEIVTASGAGAAVEIKVFSWPSLAVVHDFFPFSTFSGGAFVAAQAPGDVIFADAFGN